ncbi:hypothetical protein P6166_05740 [Stenotrophomonas sp. HITSZ_GD]|uniref:hypothetical protein n=1 Tax=Stenotrophomonas sp. HITSZ_GD TaxID=3037248 RepID=UPI00240E0A8E|nr:hypothetical protein [Stenotrophomonas sp. HITSZ_GD]MDG2524853.1 hypothetical protein [Stenotrophomonas sp. HITSZ_GD]
MSKPPERPLEANLLATRIMAFIVENLRLKELAIVAEQNRPAFNDFVNFLAAKGYPSLHSFIHDADAAKAESTILEYLTRPFPQGISLYDGIARPYAQAKAKWLLVGWILRDAPEQRLRPMVSSMTGANTAQRQASLLNKLRSYVATIFPEESRWDWTAVSEVIIDRLEGSRRAIKGTLFEAIVRKLLTDLFKANNIDLKIGDAEIRLDGETYDVSILGSRGQILMPVKTRETMGGGHALLFTRDIHKSITSAHAAGYICLPIIIAESWAGDLSTLACEDHVYVNMNPNQVIQVEPELARQLAARLKAFQAIA